MRFQETEMTLRVRPNDLDRLGHVNNATVLEYLEAGRWDWLERHGLRHASEVLPVVLRIEVDYRREIRPQEVRVRTRLELPDDVSLEEDDTYRVSFRQRIFIEAGEQLAVEAKLQVAFIDGQERSLRTLQDFLSVARASGA